MSTIETRTSTLRNLTITGSLVSSGILAGIGASLTLAGVLVTSNGAGGPGGGIWNEYGTVIIDGGVADGITAGVNGRDI